MHPNVSKSKKNPRDVSVTSTDLSRLQSFEFERRGSLPGRECPMKDAPDLLYVGSGVFLQPGP